jgi:hypothetical protein
MNIQGLTVTSAGVLYDVSSNTYNFYRSQNTTTGNYDFAYIKVAGILTIPAGISQGFIASSVIPASSFTSALPSTISSMTLSDRPTFLVTISLSTGQSAIIFGNKLSNNITVLSDPSDFVEASSSPQTDKIGVYKNINSNTINFINNFSSSVSIEIFSTFAPIDNIITWS